MNGYEIDGENIAKFVDDMKPWMDSIARQPLAIRDLILLVLVHGTIEDPYLPERVRVKKTQIFGVSSLNEQKILERVKHLEDEGLLQIENDNGPDKFELVDPTEKEIGWDLFIELYKLADKDRSVLRRAIVDLDFTIFDQY